MSTGVLPAQFSRLPTRNKIQDLFAKLPTAGFLLWPDPVVLAHPHTPHNLNHLPPALQFSPSLCSSAVTQARQSTQTNPYTMKTSFYAAAGLVAAARTAQASTPALTAQVNIDTLLVCRSTAMVAGWRDIGCYTLWFATTPPAVV